MGSGVVTVGRKTYAVGLYWENSPTSRVVSAAKEAANQAGQKADFFAIRPGQKDDRIPQFGLGQAAYGHKAGMPSFAGCLANQQPGSWAGAFRMREGVVVTVVRDDMVVPDGDQFFIDEAEARERVLQEISFGGLQKIYAPEAWSLPGADNMPIGLLLNERTDVKLQSVVTPKSVWYIAGGVVAVLVLGLIVGLYEKNMEEKRVALEAERQSALERARAEAERLGYNAGRPQAKPPERKWESQPSPLEVVESCRVGLANIPGGVAGWRLTQLKCDGRSISLAWSRDKGVSSPPPKIGFWAQRQTPRLHPFPCRN